MPMKPFGLAVLIALVSMTGPAHAYIGPGAGAGTIAVVLGILASIVMAFFAILWYPIKRLLKKKPPAKLPAAGDTTGKAAPRSEP